MSGLEPVPALASSRPDRVPGIVLEIPSGTEFLSLVRSVAAGAARLAGFREPAAEQVALAVDECTTNVIEHAYKGVTGGRIELRLEYRGLDLSVEVRDSGQPIDPEAKPTVDLERYALERRTGGLGVHLMEKIMDSVSFGRDGACNVCRLRKHKTGRDSGP